MRSIGKLAEVIRHIAKMPRLESGTLIRLLFIQLAFSMMDRSSLEWHASCVRVRSSLSFSREPIGNYAEQSKTERGLTREPDQLEKGGGGGGSKKRATTGSVLLHEYPIMTDYRGINSLFNQQTTYPACRLSNKIWRPWPRAPNDSLPSPLVFARSSTPFTIARSLHFARGHF